MSKISEQKALEKYPILFSERNGYDSTSKECLYTPCREIEEKTLFDWHTFRAEAAKDILCAMINHFGTEYIDMDDVVKWADSLISKLKEKEEK